MPFPKEIGHVYFLFAFSFLTQNATATTSQKTRAIEQQGKVANTKGGEKNSVQKLFVLSVENSYQDLWLILKYT